MTAPITASERQSLVSVAGIQGFFSEKSGGEITSEVTDVPQGGQLYPEKLAGPPNTSNVVLVKPFAPSRDGELVRRLEAIVGRWRTTVSVQPTDADLIPVGRPTVYADALLVGLVPPNTNAGSAAAQSYQLTFAVSRSA